jgi:hypothetical protein
MAQAVKERVFAYQLCEKGTVIENWHLLTTIDGEMAIIILLSRVSIANSFIQGILQDRVKLPN